MLGRLTDRVVQTLNERLDAVTKSVKVSYPNGDFYEGQVLDAAQQIRHGHGIYHYAKGKGRYEGEFVNGEKCGRGSFFFTDGDSYDGQWFGNRQHGHGVSVHWSPATGVWVYEGEFRAGQRAGSGTLLARERGALCGHWVDGRLQRGVEMRPAEGGSIYVAAVGDAFRQPPPGEEPEPRLAAENSADGAAATAENGSAAVEAAAKADGAAVGATAGAGAAGAAAPPRFVLGPSPKEWKAREVRLWLRGLGIREILDRAPLTLNGAQLLATTDMEDIVRQYQVAEGVSELAQAWRTTLGSAHTWLCRAVEDSQAQFRSWEELQGALPSLRKRFIPISEVGVATGTSRSAGEWRGMSVDLFALPLKLPPARGSARNARVPFAVARSWARDLEVLATLRHPNVRTLLGVTLDLAEPDFDVGTVTLIHEASRGGNLLFEWVHASMPDGTRRPLDVRSELRICIGICDALVALSSRGLVFAALCSVNIELLQASGGMFPRLTRTGCSWWRWGWRDTLKVREAGKPKQRSLTMDEVVRKYATCPVNWQAPEVLRGQEPTEASDVYAFGLVLWEMLYRAIPFGDFAIAQIVGTVGYGRRSLRSAASPGASTETSYLHEVCGRCSHWKAASRPSPAVLLESLRDVAKGHEQKRAKRSVFDKLGDKTEAFLTSNLLSGGFQLSFLGSDGRQASSAATPSTSAETAAAARRLPQASAGDGRRMVRLASGEWVRVDADLVESFPGDEEKWRTLMAFRARMPDSG